MLKFLGKLGKGWATYSGLALTVTGAVFAGKPHVQAALEGITANVPTIISAAGAIVAAFGIGRKAGGAASGS